jgi:hypothetical protein
VRATGLDIRVGQLHECSSNRTANSQRLCICRLIDKRLRLCSETVDAEIYRQETGFGKDEAIGCLDDLIRISYSFTKNLFNSLRRAQLNEHVSQAFILESVDRVANSPAHSNQQILILL